MKNLKYNYGLWIGDDFVYNSQTGFVDRLIWEDLVYTATVAEAFDFIKRLVNYNGYRIMKDDKKLIIKEIKKRLKK